MVKNNEEPPEDNTSKNSSVIEIIFFRNDTCPFCPRAEAVLHDMVRQLGASMFKIRKIDVNKHPDYAERYGVLTLPTIVIGELSVTGVPEPETIMKMILTSMKRIFRSSLESGDML